jgi:hypothetical protein
MHSRSTVSEALRLRDEEGLGARSVAQLLDLSVGTVRDWHAGKLPAHSRPQADEASAPACEECGQDVHDFTSLSREYVYLLGLYLGDGTISRHRRGVYRLRIFLDMKYPDIVDECATATQSVMPGSRVERLLTPSNCFQVSSYSRAWPCYFPQHGPGPKHTRLIWLRAWQEELVDRWPEALIRGLIQSDGSRFINTGRGGWRNPRYCFTNVSPEICTIFCAACDRVDLRWTKALPRTQSAAIRIYVSRKDDVARMDEFVGPKA